MTGSSGTSSGSNSASRPGTPAGSGAVRAGLAARRPSCRLPSGLDTLNPATRWPALPLAVPLGRSTLVVTVRQLDTGGHQMSLADDVKAPLRHADRFFIGGEWVQPSSDATIDVIDSGTEELFFSVAEAQAADMDRAVAAAREAFDDGPWPRLSHAERAEYLRAIAAELRQARRRPRPDLAARVGRAARHRPARRRRRAGDLRVLRRPGRHVPLRGAGHADRRRQFGLLVREPVGVVGAIIPWNAPLALITLQDRARAAGRLHGRPQVLARGAGRGLHPRRGRRGGRACRRACSTS